MAARLVVDHHAAGVRFREAAVEQHDRAAALRKVALLRQTFELGTSYSGEIVSLTKMVGALQDAGNTTTLAGYLNLLGDSGLLTGLQKFAMDKSRQRASAPKFQVFNNALKTVYNDLTFKEAILNRKEWGRIFESAIGAHIVSNAFTGNYEVFYWREKDKEVDYILKKKNRIVAIEVKSNSEMYNAGLEEIRKMYQPYASFVVGEGGMKACRTLSDRFCWKRTYTEIFDINRSEKH